MNSRIVCLFTITILIIIPIVSGDGQPPLPPCLFYGYVSVGGNLAQDNLNITATISGTTLSWSTLTKNGTYGWPVMGSSTDTNGFKILSTDPSSLTKTGGVTGDWIVFYVQGVKNAQTAYFESGGGKRFDLSVPSISTPPGSRTGSILTAAIDTSMYAGDRVDVSGKLTFMNGTGIGGASLSVTSMLVGHASWDTVSSATTSPSGNYIAQWTPQYSLNASSNYLIKISWIGATSIDGAEANLALALTAPENQLVFSVISNSTVSDLLYNSTLGVLSFTVNGPNGTTSYADVAMPKGLVENVTGLTVHVDNLTADYTSTSNPASWAVHFTYTHSTLDATITRNITLTLPAKPAPASSTPNFFQTPFGILILAIALVFAAGAGIYVARGKLRQPDEKPKKPLPKHGRQNNR